MKSRRKVAKMSQMSQMPMTLGPDTDHEAFRAEVNAAIKGVKSPTELEAAIRAVCERHGVTLGRTLEPHKLAEPVRSIVAHGAARGRVLVGQENDDVGRRFITDGRWLVYVDADQATEMLGAGGEPMDPCPPFTRATGSTMSLVQSSSSPLAMLKQYGIGERGISKTTDGFTNHAQFNFGGVAVAIDCVAVLLVAGAVSLVADADQRMVEGRSATGVTVGYVRSISSPSKLN